MNGKRWTNVRLMRACCMAAFGSVFAPSAAQTVGGVEAVQVGTNLEIRYTLDAPAEVSVWVSEDSGTSWTELTTCLSGDYGKVTTAGRKVAVWDVLSCRESLVGSGVRFKVRTGKPSPCAGAERVTFDGYDYRTVAIGNQCWFAENLRSDNYRNGDAVQGYLTNGQWTSTIAGAQAVYENDPKHVSTYGRLYNWYAVNDPRGLCPSGWHVPSDQEWDALANAVSVNKAVGERLKTKDWGGVDSHGFSARPGGGRYASNGRFYSSRLSGYWWSSSTRKSDACNRSLHSGFSNFYQGIDDANSGFSVRCIID